MVEAALSLAAQAGANTWVPVATLVHAWARSSARAKFGPASVRAVLPALRQTGPATISRGLAATLAYEAEPQFGDALALLSEALAETEAFGCAWLEGGGPARFLRSSFAA